MAQEEKKPPFTAQEIAQIKAEIAEFDKKSIEYAASSPALSAHYTRLSRASSPALKRFAAMELSLRNQENKAKRKAAREKKGPTPPPSRPQEK